MNIFGFIKRLLPNFEKRKLLQSVDLVEQKVQSTLIEVIVVKQQYLAFNENVSKSATALKYEKEVLKIVKDLPQEAQVNYATMQLEIANRVLPKLSFIRQYIDKNFEKDVAADALSFQEASVIRLLDLISFYVDYTCNFMQQITSEECEHSGATIKPALVKPVLQMLADNYAAYMQLTVIFAKKENEFEQLVKSTSHVVVSEVDEVPQGADPLRMNFMPGIGDAILAVREWKLQRDNKIHERNKMIKQSLELRVLYLKEQMENGKGSDKLAKTIEMLDARITKLDYEIKKYQEEALQGGDSY